MSDMVSEHALRSAFGDIGQPGCDFSRLLAETIEASVATLDRHGIVTYASPFFEELHGVPVSQFLGTHFTSLMWDGEREVATLLLADIAIGARFPVITWLMRRPDGTEVWVESRVTVVRNGATEVTGYITVTRDMSDRRLATQMLARARADYDALVRRAVYGVYRAERNARLLYVNPTLAALLGYERVEDVLALDLATEVFADKDDHEWLMHAAEAGELNDWVEVTWKQRDGELINVRLSIRIVTDASGGPPVFEAIAEDVTEQHRREERVRRSERMASLSQMLAGVAHELNNPLAAISGFSQLLLRGSWSGEDTKALETIGREARHAERVVRDLLMFVRQVEVTRRETVHLHDVIRHIVDTQLYALGIRGISIEMLLTDGTVLVEGDASRLELVIMNLIVNARQALEAIRGDRALTNTPLELRIATRVETGRLVEITVTDNGAGIAAPLLGRIWDPFFTTKEEGVGTGMGLSVVHSIVSEHGGSVDVKSELGRGTQFVIQLPLARRASGVTVIPSAPIASDPPVVPAATHGIRALDIMVVDDEMAIINFLSRYLGSRGHAIVGARDGMHATRIAEQFAFDLVICDLNMPEMDGIELIHRMRQLPTCANTRFVLSSGDGTSPAMLQQAKALGVDEVLDKPYSIDRLTEVVEGPSQASGVGVAG